jgi:hypothetical protein
VVDDRENLLRSAEGWMRARRWNGKLAKRRGYEQTLFEHTLIELDVLLEVLPILGAPAHCGLSPAEERILIVAVIAHDAGKETEAWQSYIHDPAPDHWVSHIIPELTTNIVPQLCSTLGFEELSASVQGVMAHCAEFHHARPGRSDGAIMQAMFTGGTDRFLTLAYLVKAIDHVCSALSAKEAEEAILSDPVLGRHLRSTRHEVVVRGVSTAFLHQAARIAFQQGGWKPVLYFVNATVYAADPNDACSIPTPEEIRSALKTELDVVTSKDATPLMVGSATGNMLPKPDLFSFSESRQYLQSAARKVGPQSLARKPLPAKRKVVEAYWKLKDRKGKPADEQVEREAARISQAQPEMMIFKFFKAMVDPDKLEVIGQDGSARSKELYEKAFGTDSWAALQSTSTLMAARDMAQTVDYFWKLPGSEVGRPQNERAETIPPEQRQEILISLLDDIAQQVYASLGRSCPRATLSSEMAEAFSNDLIQPTLDIDVQRFAREQLATYSQSKPFAGKESAKGVYLCPICNMPFKRGVKASADFIDNPQTHTNRGIAYGRFDYVMVCRTCYYERLLGQIVLGTRPAEIITLMPRLNLGPGNGGMLARKVQEWVEAAKLQMRGETGNLAVGFSLGFTDQVARHLANRDPLNIASEDLLSIFSYRFSPDTQKERRQKAAKRLKEEFDQNLETLNTACGQSFSKWEDAVEALIQDRVVQQEFKAIRREVFRLYETMYVVCRTPNLIFVPLTYEVAADKDESDTSKGLRRLYIAVLLSLVFDASVAIHKEGEPIDFPAAAGAAYVPPIPAVRALVGHEWLAATEAERWLSAIGAASLLMRDTGLPARSALWQILAADPAEKIARRIEEHGDRTLTSRHLHLIQQLPRFHATTTEVRT